MTPEDELDCWVYDALFPSAPGAGEGPLRCSFGQDVYTGHDSLVVNFTANVAGEGSAGELTYSWDFDGGVLTSASGDSPTVSASFDNYKSYTVSLTVTAASGASATKTIADCVKVGTRVVCISTNSVAAVWPYATWETATSNILEAVDSAIYVDGVRSEFVLDEGDFPILDKWLSVSAPVTVRSVAGPEKTALVPRGPTAGAR
ncbi:MAG: PKD domain-containing protein, partial [Thermoguttaceae bacterium]|nr:PKD domain-containing protein [Thermoguttaceae bacterium]